MYNNNPDLKPVAFDNTHFIYTTNFSGDPARDKFGDPRRKANIIIPSVEQAKRLTKIGCKVKQTKPRANDDPATFQPEYYVVVQTKYRKKDNTPVKYPPSVYLVTDNNPAVPLNEETIGSLDQIRVKNVNCIATLRKDEEGDKYSLFAQTMYVEQDTDFDPYASMYRERAARANEMPDDEPW